MNKELQEYGVLQKIAENIWVLDGEWFDTKFKRRMTVIKLHSGGLFVHNPIELMENDYAWLDALGKVEYVIAPNSFHASDAPLYKKRYPKAHLYVSRGAIHQVKKHCEIDGTLPGALGSVLRSEVDCLEIEGTRFLSECVFLHLASRTLIVTDLVFNMKCEVKGIEKVFFIWNRIFDRFGPSRIFRLVFLKSLTEAQQSLFNLLEWNFDRVIMNHGEILDQNGKEAVRRGFQEIGMSPTHRFR